MRIKYYVLMFLSGCGVIRSPPMLTLTQAELYKSAVTVMYRSTYRRADDVGNNLSDRQLFIWCVFRPSYETPLNMDQIHRQSLLECFPPT